MAITTTAGMRAVLLQAEINGQLEKLLAITNTDNVYYKDGETEVKLTSKIAGIIASIAAWTQRSKRRQHRGDANFQAGAANHRIVSPVHY